MKKTDATLPPFVVLRADILSQKDNLFCLTDVFMFRFVGTGSNERQDRRSVGRGDRYPSASVWYAVVGDQATTAYFHRRDELAGEVRETGFGEIRVLAVEGPAWGAAQFREAWSDPAQREKLMEFLSLIESEPSIQGASAHLIAVATPQDHDALG
jgi:hypothetical protein